MCSLHLEVCLCLLCIYIYILYIDVRDMYMSAWCYMILYDMVLLYGILTLATVIFNEIMIWFDMIWYDIMLD